MAQKITTTYLADARSLALFAALGAVAVAAPLLRSQIATGSVVNACLAVAALALPRRLSLGVAFIPSLVALSVGLLPMAMAPMIPFIVCANAIFVWILARFGQQNLVIGGLLSAMAKYAFLSLSSQVLFGVVFGHALAAPLAAMMGYLQLVTAVGGLVIAGMIIKPLKRFFA